jgi:hypothetical protein
MLFHKNIHIDSPLTTDEIKNKIQLLTKPVGTTTDHIHKFEGEVNGTDFKIYPISDYGPHNRLRPEIAGKIIDGQSTRQVNLVFGLSKSMQNLFFGGIIFNVVFGYFVSTLIPFVWWALLICVVGFIVPGQYFFNIKVTEALRLFQIELKAKVVSEA